MKALIAALLITTAASAESKLDVGVEYEQSNLQGDYTWGINPQLGRTGAWTQTSSLDRQLYKLAVVIPVKRFKLKGFIGHEEWKQETNSLGYIDGFKTKMDGPVYGVSAWVSIY